MSDLILSRRNLLAAATASAAATLLPDVATAARPTALLELFTSQGCSSCPAADALASELAKRHDIVLLSFNVDYWDYLGWRDTLAKPEFSQRQYDYARSRGDGNVYTPQMVINGTAYAVGSRKSEIDAGLAQAEPLNVAVNLTVSDKELVATIPAGPSPGEATLWLMSVAPVMEQAIERGENSGQTVVYTNVVRNLVPAAMWTGEAYEGRWMRDAVITADSSRCVAVLQEGKTGRVLGVAQA